MARHVGEASTTGGGGSAGQTGSNAHAGDGRGAVGALPQAASHQEAQSARRKATLTLRT